MTEPTNKIMPNKYTLEDLVYQILLAAYFESQRGGALKLYYIRSLKDLVDDRISEVLEERPSPIREFLCHNGWVPASVLIQQPGIDFQPGCLNALRSLRKRPVVSKIEIYRNKEGHTLYRLIPNPKKLFEETMEQKNGLHVEAKEEEIK